MICYTIANKRVATGETIREHPNWKKANEENYNSAFRAALGKRKGKMARVMNQTQPTTEGSKCNMRGTPQCYEEDNTYNQDMSTLSAILG